MENPRRSPYDDVSHDASAVAVNTPHAMQLIALTPALTPFMHPMTQKCANAQRIAGFDPPRVVSHLLKMFLRVLPPEKCRGANANAMYTYFALPSKTLFFPRQARNLVSSLHRQQLSVLSPEPRNNPALSKRLTAFRQCEFGGPTHPTLSACRNREIWIPRHPIRGDHAWTRDDFLRWPGERLHRFRRSVLSFVVAVVVVVVVRRRRHRPFSKSVLLVGKKGVVLVPDRTISSANSRPPKELCDDNTDDDDDATKTTTTVVETTSVSPPPTPPRYKNGFLFFSRRVDDADIIQKAFCFWWCRTGTKGPPKVVSSSPKKERGNTKNE